MADGSKGDWGCVFGLIAVVWCGVIGRFNCNCSGSCNCSCSIINVIIIIM